MNAAPPSQLRVWIAYSWGGFGVVLLLVRSTVRLALQGHRMLSSFHLTTAHWCALVAWTAFGTYAEGYRGFQKRFCPRVSARTRWLALHGSALDLALGPLFCLGLVRATRRRLITSWSITLGIVGLVALVSRMPPLPRGIVDFGVALPLGWGAGCLVVMYWRDRHTVPTDDAAQMPVGT